MSDPQTPTEGITMMLTRSGERWQVRTSSHLPDAMAFELGEAMACLQRHVQSVIDRTRMPVAAGTPQDLADFERGLASGKQIPQTRDEGEFMVRKIPGEGEPPRE